MMSADVKVSIRQQEIKDLVVHLTIIYKSYLQNLKYNVKSGCIFHLILVGILSISILYIIRPQSINCLVCVSFAPKNGAGWQAEAKKFGFFEKKKTKHILPVSYQTCSAKQMLFQLRIHHQNKGKEVRFYSAISRYIYSFVLLSVLFICIIFLWINTHINYANNQVMLIKNEHMSFGILKRRD